MYLKREDWEQAFAADPTPAGVAKVVESHLLTQGQQLWLDNHHLTVVDVLTGKHAVGQYAQVQFLFSEWNRVVGYQQFKV